MAVAVAVEERIVQGIEELEAVSLVDRTVGSPIEDLTQAGRTFTVADRDPSGARQPKRRSSLEYRKALGRKLDSNRSHSGFSINSSWLESQLRIYKSNKDI